MDEILTKLAVHTATLASRQSSFCLQHELCNGKRQVASYIKQDSTVRKIDTSELERARESLDISIKIVQPAIDLIEIISQRGNTSLEPAVARTLQLRKEIDAFAHKITMETSTAEADDAAKMRKFDHMAMIKDMQALTIKIEKFVPYLNLVLTTSGANLGWSLPNSVSPSRLMQASSLLNDTHHKFIKSAEPSIRVGSPFKVKLYYLFAGNVRPKSVGDFTWKEEFTKCDAEVIRIRNNNHGNEEGEFCYELILTEDLNDGRYHEEFDMGDRKKQKETIAKLGKSNVIIPGKVKRITVRNISRLYYNSSGSLLNIEESKSPVLVITVIKGAPTNRHETLSSGVKDNPFYVLPSVAAPATPDTRTRNSYDTDNDKVDTESTPCSPTPKTQTPSTPLRDPSLINRSYSTPQPVKNLTEMESLNTPSRIPLPQSDDDIASDESTVEDDLTETGGIENPTTATKTENVTLVASPEPVIPNGQIQDDGIADDSTGDNDDNSGMSDPLDDFEAYRSNLKTLSLFEYILRLSALEMSEQKQHLEISDEKINLFIKDDDGTSTSTSITSVGSVNDTPGANRSPPRTASRKKMSASKMSKSQTSRRLLFIS
ncbi:6681_t:CDS:2 [Paraglomus occultum]|uniref:6681_t:CDS:1 n=1 Tax=Paraglomus occultum TaxID=144539 RepID=A0A9N8Z4M4_9GLOM|nr:6681_t:CDS:2 [Paraglomus occultum]